MLEEQHTVSAAASASGRQETGSPKSQEDEAQTERNMIHVRNLVEKLVIWVLKKVNWTPTQADAIIQRLFKRIWAELEGVKLAVTPATCKHLDLLKRSGCPEMVLTAMYLQEPQLEKRTSFCVFVVKKLVAISRFFSPMGRVISRPFRQT